MGAAKVPVAPAASATAISGALAPGAVASEVARAAGIHTSQLFRWRQQLCGPATASAGFSPVAIMSGGASASAATSSTIETELAGGIRIRITGAADPATVSALIAALAKIARPR